MNEPTTRLPATVAPTALTPMQEELQRMQLAREICRARSLPPSFQNNPADVYLLMQVCDRFGLSFTLAVWECYSVKGRIGFGGKIAGAMLLNSGKLATRLHYSYTGQGDDLTIQCSARLVGEQEPRVSEAVLKNARTEHNENWRKDPKQQLIYFVTRKWGRAHCPEVMLGAMFDGDEPIDITPTVIEAGTSPIEQVLEQRQAAPIQPAAEPQPGDPFALKLPEDSTDTKTGEVVRMWRSWGQTLIAYVRGAKTKEQIDRWAELNNDAILLMRDEMPALHRSLEHAIGEHRTTLETAKKAEATS